MHSTGLSGKVGVGLSFFFTTAAFKGGIEAAAVVVVVAVLLVAITDDAVLPWLLFVLFSVLSFAMLEEKEYKNY